jgi:NAD(P)H-hydrate epimerase
LITLYTMPETYVPVAAQLQSTMVHPWTPPFELPGTCTAILAGPGLAAPQVPPALRDVVRELWRQSPLAMVVDASALAWLPAGKVPDGALRVITPHPGEAARLLEASAAEVQQDRPKALRQLSGRFGGCWVILKGHQTLIGRSQGEAYVNSSGNPYLAQGGSGDLLGGYVAGLLAQPPLQRAAHKTLCYGVWQHGAAADVLQHQRRNWTIEDLAAMLGSA